MQSYQIYVIILCLIVYTALTALSISCISIISRLNLRLIRSGADDQRIVEEHRKKQNKKPNKVLKIIDYAFSSIVCLVMVLVFIASFFVGCTNDNSANTEISLPSYRVVRTNSMSEKNPDNKYLVDNDLNDQIQTFDLIRTKKLPDEMELKLYDIVVYETDGMLIVHRIVEIEEPNDRHPDCRHFRLQGDAIDSPDRFPVLYEQMRAIYTGDRIPFVGSFILFMQSPPGWLCILLIVVSMISSPILEKVFEKEKNKRLLLYIDVKPEEQTPVTTTEPIETKHHTIISKHVSAKKAASGRIGEVNVGTLDAHYHSGDVVNIHSLKHKKLISKSCKRVRILENGTLKKALTVHADSFSPKAASKIVNAGGKIIKPSLAKHHEKSELSGGDQLD